MANVDDLVKKSYGQLGSVFADADGAITPPTGKVFIAVTSAEVIAASESIIFQTEINDVLLSSSGSLIAYIGE